MSTDGRPWRAAHRAAPRVAPPGARRKKLVAAAVRGAVPAAPLQRRGSPRREARTEEERTEGGAHGGGAGGAGAEQRPQLKTEEKTRRRRRLGGDRWGGRADGAPVRIQTPGRPGLLLTFLDLVSFHGLISSARLAGTDLIYLSIYLDSCVDAYYFIFWDLPGDVLAAPASALYGWIGVFLLSLSRFPPTLSLSLPGAKNLCHHIAVRPALGGHLLGRLQ